MQYAVPTGVVEPGVPAAAAGPSLGVVLVVGAVGMAAVLVFNLVTRPVSTIHNIIHYGVRGLWAFGGLAVSLVLDLLGYLTGFTGLTWSLGVGAFLLGFGHGHGVVSFLN